MTRNLEDQILIERALAGDQQAYEGLVFKHQKLAARVALRITRRRELVEDVVQEVFIKAFENLGRFRRRSGFVTWLYRIAVNESLSALRREKTRMKLFEKGEPDLANLPDSLLCYDRESGERMVLDREAQAAVREALDRLAPEMRAVLTLRYEEELSTPEIAEVLDVPEGTVRSRLYYARLELAELLAPYMEAKTAVKEQK